VALAISKGADVTEKLLARRYCDAYIAVEGLALGDTLARDSILNGIAPGDIPPHIPIVQHICQAGHVPCAQ